MSVGTVIIDFIIQYKINIGTIKMCILTICV